MQTEDVCGICYENINKKICCEKCSFYCCEICFDKLTTEVCPQCKYKKFNVEILYKIIGLYEHKCTELIFKNICLTEFAKHVYVSASQAIGSSSKKMITCFIGGLCIGWNLHLIYSKII